MTLPYTASRSEPHAIRVAGTVLVPPRSHPAVFVRAAATVALAVLVIATRLFGLMRPRDLGDALVLWIVGLWFGIVLGPIAGTLCDAGLARRGYRELPATLAEEGLSYWSWGIRRRIVPEDLAASRTVGGEVLLAFQTGTPTMLFRRRGGGCDLPRWVTMGEPGKASWSFVWRNASSTILGPWKSIAWVLLVMTATAAIPWTGGYVLPGTLFLPYILLGVLGAVLQRRALCEIHPTALLIRDRAGWALHSRRCREAVVLRADEGNGLCTTEISSWVGDKKVLWQPVGGALSTQRQAEIIRELCSAKPTSEEEPSEPAS